MWVWLADVYHNSSLCEKCLLHPIKTTIFTLLNQIFGTWVLLYISWLQCLRLSKFKAESPWSNICGRSGSTMTYCTRECFSPSLWHFIYYSGTSVFHQPLDFIFTEGWGEHFWIHKVFCILSTTCGQLPFQKNCSNGSRKHNSSSQNKAGSYFPFQWHLT